MWGSVLDLVGDNELVFLKQPFLSGESVMVSSQISYVTNTLAWSMPETGSGGQKGPEQRLLSRPNICEQGYTVPLVRTCQGPAMGGWHKGTTWIGKKYEPTEHSPP